MVLVDLVKIDLISHEGVLVMLISRMVSQNGSTIFFTRRGTLNLVVVFGIVGMQIVVPRHMQLEEVE
jgi:hypothetical protein